MVSDLSLFIRHARILSPTGELYIGDVETRGGEIVRVAPEIPASAAGLAAREIDAKGLTLLPGVIDPQVHFREPGLEHKFENQGWNIKKTYLQLAVLVPGVA
jgi:dihydroorotase